MALTNSIKQSGSGMAALYRRYAEWLVSITWKRFIVLSLLLLIVTGMLSSLPPFNWDLATRTTRVPASRSVDITVDDNGVQMRSDPQAPPPTPPSAKHEAAGVAGEITQELAQEIRREVIDAIGEMGDDERVVHVRLGNYMPQLAFLFILLSA